MKKKTKIKIKAGISLFFAEHHQLFLRTFNGKLLFLSFPLHFLGFHCDVFQDHRLDLHEIDVNFGFFIVSLRVFRENRRHFRVHHEKHPSIAEMRGDFFDLYFLEAC